MRKSSAQNSIYDSNSSAVITIHRAGKKSIAINLLKWVMHNFDNIMNDWLNRTRDIVRCAIIVIHSVGSFDLTFQNEILHNNFKSKHKNLRKIFSIQMTTQYAICNDESIECKNATKKSILLSKIFFSPKWLIEMCTAWKRVVDSVNRLKLHLTKALTRRTKCNHRNGEMHQHLTGNAAKQSAVKQKTIRHVNESVLFAVRSFFGVTFVRVIAAIKKIPSE